MTSTYSRTFAHGGGGDEMFILDGFGHDTGVLPRAFLTVIKSEPLVTAQAEVTIALDGTTAVADNDDQETIPAMAAQTTLNLSSASVRSRVMAGGDFTVSVHCLTAGDIRFESNL